MNRRPFPTALLGILVVASALLAGCAGATSCSNGAGSYACSFGGGGQISRSDTWSNPSGGASVQFQVGGSSNLNLAIQDASGHTVLAKSVSGSGGTNDQWTTARGTPGTWRVDIQGSYAGGLHITITSR